MTDPSDAEKAARGLTTNAGEAQQNLQSAHQDINGAEGEIEEVLALVEDLEDTLSRLRLSASESRSYLRSVDTDRAWDFLTEEVPEYHAEEIRDLDVSDPRLVEHRIVDGTVYAVYAEKVGDVNDDDLDVLMAEDAPPIHHRDPNDE